MSKPDKLPALDPTVRGIFDLLIATAAQVRKDRRSHEYIEAEKRIEQARGDRAKVLEREAKEALRKLEERDMEAAKRERGIATAAFLELRPGQPLLSLRRD